jgi:hypothetical protein
MVQGDAAAKLKSLQRSRLPGRSEIDDGGAPFGSDESREITLRSRMSIEFYADQFHLSESQVL